MSSEQQLRYVSHFLRAHIEELPLQTQCNPQFYFHRPFSTQLCQYLLASEVLAPPYLLDRNMS